MVITILILLIVYIAIILLTINVTKKKVDEEYLPKMLSIVARQDGLVAGYEERIKILTDQYDAAICALYQQELNKQIKLTKKRGSKNGNNRKQR